MKKLLLFVLLAALLAACSPSPAPQPTATLPPAVTQPALEATATTPPTATPHPGKVALVDWPGAHPAGQPVQAALAELAASSGWELEALSELAPGTLTADHRVVVLPAPPANLDELLAGAPQAQFVVYSAADLPPAANLTVIHQPLDVQAFLAGYLSVVITPDFRAGGLLPADGPLGAQLQEAYLNGGRYFCGVCAPGWPLGVYFPVTAALPSASSGAEWAAAAADMFDNKKVDLYFLAPEALHPELIEYLRDRTQLDRTVRLIGLQPPPDALRAQWAASLVYDGAGALRQVWPQVSAGQGGQALRATLALEDVNETLLSPGRLRLIEDLIADLQAGWVDPLSVPNQ